MTKFFFFQTEWYFIDLEWNLITITNLTECKKIRFNLHIQKISPLTILWNTDELHVSITFFSNLCVLIAISFYFDHNCSCNWWYCSWLKYKRRWNTHEINERGMLVYQRSNADILRLYVKGIWWLYRMEAQEKIHTFDWYILEPIQALNDSL